MNAINIAHNNKFSLNNITIANGMNIIIRNIWNIKISATVS